MAFDSGFDDGSPMRRRLETAFDKFVAIDALSDSAAASIIRDKEIDILINLNGYFGTVRIGVFAWRPAPIQVNYLGFPDTLAAPYIDYLITDRIVTPPSEKRHYSENLVFLPGSYQANDDKRAIAQSDAARAGFGLLAEGFVFCNFKRQLQADTRHLRILDADYGKGGKQRAVAAGRRCGISHQHPPRGA